MPNINRVFLFDVCTVHALAYIENEKKNMVVAHPYKYILTFLHVTRNAPQKVNSNTNSEKGNNSSCNSRVSSSVNCLQMNAKKIC